MHLTLVTTQSCKKEQKDRKAQQTDFYHHSFLMCRNAFKCLNVISHDKLTAFITH